MAEGGFPSITDEHVQRYASEGYVLVRGGFDNVVTANALEAIDRICAEADPRFEKACEGTVFDPERASVRVLLPDVSTLYRCTRSNRVLTARALMCFVSSSHLSLVP